MFTCILFLLSLSFFGVQSWLLSSDNASSPSPPFGYFTTASIKCKRTAGARSPRRRISSGKSAFIFCSIRLIASWIHCMISAMILRLVLLVRIPKTMTGWSRPGNLGWRHHRVVDVEIWCCSMGFAMCRRGLVLSISLLFDVCGILGIFDCWIFRYILVLAWIWRLSAWSNSTMMILWSMMIVLCSKSNFCVPVHL